MSQEKIDETGRLHAVAQMGDTARLTLSHMHETVMIQQDSVLKQLKSHYRASQLDANRMLSLVGQLCALDELIHRYKVQITNGDRAKEQIMNGGI